MSASFKYIVVFGGGQGPDVWDGEKEVSAVDIEDAVRQVKGQIEDAGGWIFSAEQLDYPERVPLASAKDIEALENIEQLIMTALPTNHPGSLDWARIRMLLKRQSKNIEALQAAVISLTPPQPGQAE